VDSFVVSTTSTLEGYEIDRYLGIVSAQVVAGTDVFTDIVASFSDFFGGRSGVYKRELSAIGKEALEELRGKCDRLGANALVGVRIDHDEISGKGKAMLMVTASGTAVVASPTRKDEINIRQLSDGGPDHSQTHVAAGVDRDALAVLLQREMLLRATAAGKRKLDDESWSFLIQHRVSEAASHILRALQDSHVYERGYHATEEELERYVKYFSVIPEEPAAAALYETIAQETSAHWVDDLLEIIDAVGLVEYNRVYAMLQSRDRDEQLLGVRLLKCSKKTYTATDVALMEKCCEQVERLFPSSAEVSSGQKKVWICECGKKNDVDEPYCTKCGRSKRGVRQSEAPIDQILGEVDLQISVLKKAFPETSPPA